MAIRTLRSCSYITNKDPPTCYYSPFFAQSHATMIHKYWRNSGHSPDAMWRRRCSCRRSNGWYSPMATRTAVVLSCHYILFYDPRSTCLRIDDHWCLTDGFNSIQLRHSVSSGLIVVVEAVILNWLVSLSIRVEGSLLNHPSHTSQQLFCVIVFLTPGTSFISLCSWNTVSFILHILPHIHPSHPLQTKTTTTTTSRPSFTSSKNKSFVHNEC